MTRTDEPPRNRPHGAWFGWLFVAAGVFVVLMTTVGPMLGWESNDGDGVSLLGAAVGLLFAGAGATVVVMDRRNHGQATPPERTRAALVAAGWRDLTDEARAAGLDAFPAPVLRVLRSQGHAWTPHGTVPRLAGIHPTGLHAVGVKATDLDGEIRVAESWVVTSTSETNGRVVGGTIEPRVVAWLPLPADIGRVTIRPDSARMKLADLTGVRPDHEVEWEAVDDTWHLHGDDEPLLRAVVDIGLMGRLAELPGRWVVRFDGPWLLVIPTADRGALTAKPPTLEDVTDDIDDVVHAVRSILPQMLWRDLDAFLAAYRA